MFVAWLSSFTAKLLITVLHLWSVALTTHTTLASASVWPYRVFYNEQLERSKAGEKVASPREFWARTRAEGEGWLSGRLDKGSVKWL